ncbi:heterokaryon incompatibility protein-domain-containing protein [Xylaria cubensis]|nr:heterokaryon incompatibility protein-domain-containing protein [Xylaria cubensis]
MHSPNSYPGAFAQDPYIYRQLSHSCEIRLATLLPGELHEPIRLHISHVHHATLTKKSNNIMNLDSLKRTLPNKWKVYETTESQAFFYYEEDDGSNWKATWEHPDPTFDRSLYVASENGTEPSCHSATYEAISYTWGTGEASNPVFVTDDKSIVPAVLTIGSNLATALTHLRYKDRSRSLWIDAICINQSDENERTAQVKRMSAIYKQASRVVVWLGPGDYSSALAIRTLDYLGRQVVTTKDNWMFCTPDAEEPWWCEANCKLPYNEETWKAISELLARSWFERVWVIQEIQLANYHAVIQCGAEEISWSNFRKAIVTLWNKNNMPSILPRAKLFFVEQLTRNNIRQVPASHILRLIKNRQCTDPRDLVFALLGLLPQPLRQVLQPDYGASVNEVYKDVFIKHIEYTNRLELLRDCSFRSHTQSRLTSWAPDFSTSGSWPKPIDWQFAAGYSPCRARLINTNMLEVMGVSCAVIKDVLPATSIPCGLRDDRYSSTDPDSDPNLKVGNAHPPYKGRERTYRTGEPIWSVYTKITTGNYLRERFPIHNVPTLDDWASHLSNNNLATGLVTQGNSIKGVSSFHEDYSRDLMRHRYFITTNEGYLGLGPAGAQQGDVICVFFGCDSPIVLRPESGGGYSVVGECYVCGLEDATALLGPLEDHWRVQVFTESTDHRRNYRFMNKKTGVLSDEDPRLPPLPTDWERIDTETISGPTTFQLYKNKKTGQVINYDPRLTPEMIVSKGATIQRFILI